MQLQNNSTPNIVTFGSCLSRYTSNHYVRLFGGKIISSVYHNRSDAFCGRLLDQSWYIDPFDEIKSSLLKEEQQSSNQDNNSTQILKNQYLETIGLHRLSSGQPLFDAVKSGKVDLFVVDNYMDLAARLVKQPSKPTSGLFLRIYDFAVPEKIKDRSKGEAWAIGEHLSPEDGIKYMSRILDFFREYNPAARIVFINFPHNTYSHSPERVARTQEYERLFNYQGCDIIPCMTIPEMNQTEDKMHFKPTQYAAYAGLIKGMALQRQQQR